jgi:peptide-methionine (S)-S-oxide reductase
MQTEIATFANGCFWCTEAVFKRLKGVNTVISGYTGGKRKNPSYEQVSTGATGHAEAIQVAFDPTIISYEKLLSVFFATHDPTTLDRQGADVGSQYRSAIFYHSQKQKGEAESKIRHLTEAHVYKDPIVTEVLPFLQFYKAEHHHQNYYDANRSYPYCRVIIDPKVQKLLKDFAKDVRDEFKEA